MPASAQANSPKRIKIEATSVTEPKITESVTTASDPIYDTIIDFKVGENRTTFGIHRGLLRRESSFFREQLSKSETAGDGNAAETVVLKDEDPDIFRRFNTWLYSEKIISESETYKNLPWGVVIEVYSFAERIGIRRLQNNCVDAVIRKRRDGGLFRAQGDVNTLWKRPGNLFRLRRLLLDLFATGCNLTSAMANNGSYHPQFLQGLVQTMFEMKAQGRIYDQVDFWKKRRIYYVDDNENPILLD